jgi:hypothetical protein
MCTPSTNEQKMEVINGRKELFIVNIKGHIPAEKFDNRTPGAVSDFVTVLNFPPVYMNLEITTNRETIGETMYEYMRTNDIPTDKKKLNSHNCSILTVSILLLRVIISGFYLTIIISRLMMSRRCTSLLEIQHLMGL